MSLSEIDPDVLLEWLQTAPLPPEDGSEDSEGSGGMQQVALEQLCMVLLMSDNIDRCFELCPPRTFLPALCHIMISGNSSSTPSEEVISTLEVCARAMTYYLDVSAECSRRITQVDGAVKALCDRLLISPDILIASRTARDLAEQCIKVFYLSKSLFKEAFSIKVLSFAYLYGVQDITFRSKLLGFLVIGVMHLSLLANFHAI